MEDLFGKSAKMWLQEICVKQMVRPNYDTQMFLSGPPPVFLCKLSIKYTDKILRAEAQGKTKKDSEQEAAKLMLFQGLEMTPKKLYELHKAGKSANKPCASAEGSEGAGDNNGCENLVESVSDTDESELARADNPSGELLAICIENDFDEPEYEVVKEEGPPHKKVFTMRCNVCVGDEKVTAIGRRERKKAAKKLAALRTLRLMNLKGYHLSPLDETDGNSNGDDEKSGICVDTEANHDNKVSQQILNSVTKELATPEQIFEALESLSGRIYCTNVSEQCLELCTNYRHAFQHLNKSETLDLVLTTPVIDDVFCEEHGGPMTLMENIAREIECSIDICTFPEDRNLPIVAFLQLKFPQTRFKNHKIPLVNTVHSEGKTLNEAKENAAKQALKYLKTMMN